MKIKYEYDNTVYINGKKNDVHDLGVPRGFEKYFIGLYFNTSQFKHALDLANKANEVFNSGIVSGNKDIDFVTESNRLLAELENYVSTVDPVGYLGYEAEEDATDYDDTLWGC